MKATVLVILISLVSLSPCAAVPVVDQQQPFDPRGSGIAAPVATSTVEDKAQTFTVGVSGVLAGLWLPVLAVRNPNAPLIVDVRPTSSGVPVEGSGSALAQVSVAPDAINTLPRADNEFPFTTVDLSPVGVTVTSGEVLAIVLHSDSDLAHGAGLYVWFGSSADYPRGAFFEHDFGFWQQFGASPGDLGFVTFVGDGPPPSSVPESATALLLIVGVVVLSLGPSSAGAISIRVVHQCGNAAA